MESKVDQEELNDLAAMLAIPTEEKADAVIPPVAEPEKVASTTQSKVEDGSSGAAGQGLKLTDVINADDAADNLVNSIDAIQSIIFNAILSAKTYYALPSEDRKTLKAALKKPVAQRTADEIILHNTQKEVFAKNQKKADELSFTEEECFKLRKSAKALVVQENIKVSPKLAFALVVTNLIADRATDIFLDD